MTRARVTGTERSLAMDLNSSLQSKKFDVRLIERNVQNGTITAKDMEKHLKDLPDLTHQSEKMKMDNSSNSDKFNQ